MSLREFIFFPKLWRMGLLRFYRQSNNWISALAALVAGLWVVAAFAGQDLNQELAVRQSRVAEFDFIAKEARRLSVRAWITGDTAMTYARHIHRMMQAEQGALPQHHRRLTYDFTDIFESTQPIEVAVEGRPDQVEEIRRRLNDVFGHAVQQNSLWRVSAMTETSPQHANAVDVTVQARIEIGAPPHGPPAPFVRELAQGKLRFHSSGASPEARLLDVVKYLVHVFQYDLQMDDGSHAAVLKIVREFDPKKGIDSAIGEQIEEEGRLLLKKAVHLRAAIQTLDEMGLRQKLLDIRANPFSTETRERTLSWWMYKETVKFSEVSTLTTPRARPGSAQAIAEERGMAKLHITHGTDSFASYEAITRAPDGEANFFTSRDFPGEKAVFGHGIYFYIGDYGGGKTGHDITLEVLPAAQMGIDFIIPEEQPDMLILRNAGAARIVYDDTRMSPLEYFEKHAKSGFRYNDEAKLRRLQRRLISQINLLNPIEQKRLIELVSENFGRGNVPAEWMRLRISQRYPEIVENFIRTHPERKEWLASAVFGQPDSEVIPFWTDRMIAQQLNDVQLANYVFSHEFVRRHPDFPRWAEQLAARGKADVAITAHFFGTPESAKYPQLMADVISRGGSTYAALMKGLTREHWSPYPELLMQVLDSPSSLIDGAAQRVLAMPMWQQHPVLRKACGDQTPTLECLRKAKGNGFNFKAAAAEHRSGRGCIKRVLSELIEVTDTQIR